MKFKKNRQRYCLGNLRLSRIDWGLSCFYGAYAWFTQRTEPAVRAGRRCAGKG